MNKPIPVTHADLVEILKSILSSVEEHDSFEGSLEYLMPQLQDHELDLVANEPLNPYCNTCGIEATSEKGLREFHDGDPKTTESGEKTDFMVRASYRVGNSMGQGGMRVIGKM